jgi:RNA polymerase sigma-70 factor, ECF subfamily
VPTHPSRMAVTRVCNPTHSLEPFLLSMRILSESCLEVGVPIADMDVPPPMSETELLRMALAGDEDAFQILYDRLKTGIFRYAFYMTNSRTAAEEVTQEVFITLVRNGNRFDPLQGDLGAFTFGLARNIVHRVLRRERSYWSLFTRNSDDSGIKEPSTASDSLTGKLIENQRAAQLRAAIAALPEHYRQVVVLCDLCEFSYGEAAARLDCAIGTVRSRLHRGHALLTQKMKVHAKQENEMRNAGAEGCLT